MTAALRRALTPKRALAGTAAVLAVLAAATSIAASRQDNSPQRTQRVAEHNRPSLWSSTSSVAHAVAVDATTLAAEIEREDDHVTALELAQWIRERKPGLRVLDVRTDSEFAAYHIPSAERMPLTALASLAPRDEQTLVLYSEGGAHAAQGWVLLRANGHRTVYFLRGGLLDWMEDVMSPALPADTSRDRIAALSRYFGGVPRAGITPLPAPAAPTATASSAVARLRRRGC